MDNELHGLAQKVDIEDLRLPRLVRSQLQRHHSRRARPAVPLTDVEERVRDTLYGKGYYGNRRSVLTDWEGDHGSQAHGNST